MGGPPVTVSIHNTDLNLAHGTATVTFTFSAPPPLGFTLDDTSAVGGTLSNLSQLNATTYTATFTAAANTDIANASVSVTQTSPVTFSSAVATFYEVQNNWAPSQMIDGIFTEPNQGIGLKPSAASPGGAAQFWPLASRCAAISSSPRKRT